MEELKQDRWPFETALVAHTLGTHTDPCHHNWAVWHHCVVLRKTFNYGKTPSNGTEKGSEGPHPPEAWRRHLGEGTAVRRPPPS